jgi:hypothetical protein
LVLVARLTKKNSPVYLARILNFSCGLGLGNASSSTICIWFAGVAELAQAWVRKSQNKIVVTLRCGHGGGEGEAAGRATPKHRRENEPVALCRDADQVLAAMHDELADGDLLGFGERVWQHNIAFVGVVTIAQKPASQGAGQGPRCRPTPHGQRARIWQVCAGIKEYQADNGR